MHLGRQSMTSAPLISMIWEVSVVKVELKKFVRKIKRANIDWNFWLNVGTFLATLRGALK